MLIDPRDMAAFVRESNRIEGIYRDPTKEEVQAHLEFTSRPATVEALEALVSVCAPTHVLRDRPGLNVRVGNYIAPRGGPEIRDRLEALLAGLGDSTPHAIHIAYESLHPFTDGNGRTGRALWLWMMLRGAPWEVDACIRYGFLHAFYYQTLEANDG